MKEGVTGTVFTAGALTRAPRLPRGSKVRGAASASTEPVAGHPGQAGRPDLTTPSPVAGAVYTFGVRFICMRSLFSDHDRYYRFFRLSSGSAAAVIVDANYQE
uniref:Uncharacterized protein n=1 Tax=Oryza sativa subsp. japonica TaxID=39947 RepID=Q654X1_ORYSJ|nr:hypothetical protein [Oryza sativa Japonica Group]